MSPRENVAVPPADEQDAFFCWVWEQACAEGDGTPETELINQDGSPIAN